MGSEWHHFELREYDPVIGRWLVPDPFNQYWSPFINIDNDPANNVDPDGGKGGPVRKPLNINPDVTLAVYNANGMVLPDLTFQYTPSIGDRLSDGLYAYAQLVEPELYGNLIIKVSEQKGRGKVTIPIYGGSASLSKDGLRFEPIDPSSTYLSYKASDALEYRIYPALGNNAPGEDGNVRILILVHRRGAWKVQGDITVKRNGDTLVGGRIVGEAGFFDDKVTAEFSIGYRQKLPPTFRFWTLLPGKYK